MAHDDRGLQKRRNTQADGEKIIDDNDHRGVEDLKEWYLVVLSKHVLIGGYIYMIRLVGNYIFFTLFYVGNN